MKEIKCWKMFATYIFSHIGNTTDHIWKNTLVSDLSVLLNDIIDNIEHITIIWLYVINYFADFIAFFHSFPYLSLILTFSVKMCYPTFAVRIINDKSVYLTTNPRQPMTAKCALLDPLNDRDLVIDHLAVKGCLRFAVR